MSNQQHPSIDDRLNELIALCVELKHKNAALQKREQELLRERSVLIEKNELARSKVETMINRLKGLSSESA